MIAAAECCRRCARLLSRLLCVSPMRRMLSRLTTRLLLRVAFTPAMGGEAEIHTHGRRKLVVGLGNPGMEGTRHSVGMAVLGALAARLGVAERWRGDRQVSGEVALAQTPHAHLVLLRPRLLMNLNGVAVAKAAQKFGVPPEDILLVHDELDKPLGKVAVKVGGSARGHNGVRSCVDCLQTDVMRRVRVGIGRPSGKTSVERHVLGRFSAEEQKLLSAALQQSVELLLSQLSPQDAAPPSPPAGGGKGARRTHGRRSQEPAAEEAAAAAAAGHSETPTLS